MTDLVEFIEARLAEDERAALAATRNVWTVDSWTNDTGVEFLIIADYDQGAPAFALKSERDAAHIARHDPARVLREVAAKRALLLEIAFELADDPMVMEGMTGERLRVLASVWSDHQDFRPEWNVVPEV